LRRRLLLSPAVLQAVLSQALRAVLQEVAQGQVRV